jgi:hypothetical protein
MCVVPSAPGAPGLASYVSSIFTELHVSLGTISNIDYVILLCQRMAETREF